MHRARLGRRARMGNTSFCKGSCGALERLGVAKVQSRLALFGAKLGDGPDG